MRKEILTDQVIALAKTLDHAEATDNHLLVALLEDQNIDFADRESLLTAARSALPTRGNAIDPPSLLESTHSLLQECTNLEGSLAVAQRLIADLPSEIDTASLSTSSATQHEPVEASPQKVPPSTAEAHKSVEEVMAEFDKLVGLDEVKAQVFSLVQSHELNRRRQEESLNAVPVGLHLVFTGSPGTGKTTVGRLVADLYRALGLLPRGHLVEVQRADLVAGYVGQTAIKTEQAIKSALGGVLFIDEAYSLANESSQDFGSEAIATLVKMMEDHRENLAVIAAGYSDEMGYFISSNAGLKSRFQNYIDFRNFGTQELVEIFKIKADEYKISISEEVCNELHSFFELLPAEEREGNGRFARNLFETMYGRMAARVGEDGIITEEEIAEGFTADDIPDYETPPEKPGFGFQR